MDSLIGRTLGKVTILEQLGQGGMAEVYKARQANLDRDVAVKVLHAHLAQEEGFRERFEREAKNVASLHHPNIVQVYDFDVEGDLSYMVMEYVDGETLKTRLEALRCKDTPLPPDQVVRITRDVTSALAYAHERGMVHRDVKPANVMLDRSGRVFLTDFGIAKILAGPQQTATGLLMGTPAYMSPEQCRGEAGDERSDLYSLGILLFELATLSLPFNADTALAIVYKHLSDPLPAPRSIRADLPEALERIVLRAAAKAPEERYQRAGEVLADLDALQAEMPTRVHVLPPVGEPRAPALSSAHETVVAPVPRLDRPARKTPWPMLLGGVALLGVVGVGLVLFAGLPALFGAGKATPTPELSSPTRVAPATSVAALPTPSPPRPSAEPSPSQLPSPEPTAFSGHADSPPGGGAYCSSGAPHAELPPFADPVALDVSTGTAGLLEVTITLADPAGLEAVPPGATFYSLDVLGTAEGLPGDELSVTDQAFFNGLRFDAGYDVQAGRGPEARLALWSPEAQGFVPGPAAVRLNADASPRVIFEIDVRDLVAADPALAARVQDGRLALRIAVLAQYWQSEFTSDSWCKAIGRGADGRPALPVSVDLEVP